MAEKNEAPRLTVKVKRKAVSQTLRARFARWWKCRVQGDHEWVEVRRHHGHDVGLNEDRCKHCPVHRQYVN